MCCLNEEWRLMRVNFQENFTFGRRTSKFAKENPQNCPPPKRKEKKKKKNPKHLKCSLTRAKDESHKRVDSSSLFLSLSLSLSVHHQLTMI